MFVARREKFLDSHMVLKALQQTGTLVSEWSKVFCFKICIYNKIPLELPDKIRLFFTVVDEPIFGLLGAVSGKGSSSGFIIWQPAGSPAVAIGSLEMVRVSWCMVVVTTEEAV